MSTPIEREIEEHDEEEPEQPEPEQQPEQPEQTEQTETTPSEQPEQPDAKPPAIPDYANKVVKKLSKDERQHLLDGFEQGVEDPYFKVVKMSNGSMRITKRKNPLTNDVKTAVENVNERVVSKATKHSNGTRLTNEQLLMEHIIDLESRFECMRLKHKKLKKRYNELENSIYEDVDDRAVERPEPEPEPEQPQPQPEPARTTVVKRLRGPRTSWRDAVSYM